MNLHVHGHLPASNPLRVPHKVPNEVHRIDPSQPDWRAARLARLFGMSMSAASIFLREMVTEADHAS